MSETLSIQSATYLHTIPSGEEASFEVHRSRWSDCEIVVSYPETTDLSPFCARDAYPFAAIERDWGTFVFCVAHGTDYGTSWEVWEVREEG
jgi:hypothetical protein